MGQGRFSPDGDDSSEARPSHRQRPLATRKLNREARFGVVSLERRGHLYRNGTMSIYRLGGILADALMGENSFDARCEYRTRSGTDRRGGAI